MSDKTYTIGQVANKLNVSKRTIQRKLRRLGTPTINGAYLITNETLKNLFSDKELDATSRDKIEHIKLEAGEVIEQADGSILECFSPDKYQHLQSALIERLELKIELGELNKRLEQLQQWKNDFMQYTSQRNTIEAWDKGLIQQMDKDEVDEPTWTESETAEDIQQHIQAKRSEVIKAKKQFTDWLKEI